MAITFDDMTIKHSIYMPKVPFQCTERACVVFFSVLKFAVKKDVTSSVTSFKDRRGYNILPKKHYSLSSVTLDVQGKEKQKNCCLIVVCFVVIVVLLIVVDCWFVVPSLFVVSWCSCGVVVVVVLWLSLWYYDVSLWLLYCYFVVGTLWMLYCCLVVVLVVF